MSKLPICDAKGAPSGELEIPDGLLELGKGSQAVHDSIVRHFAGIRAGTASTLGKGEVAGSNKKPWLQKGLGRARAGYRQSPVWRGGGIAFGPHPRSYEKDMPKAVARLAFRRALSEKISGGAMRVIEAFTVARPKTREFAALLKALKVEGPVLCVTGKADPDVIRSARNLPRLEIAVARDVSVFQLVRYPVIVADRAAVGVLEKRLAKNRGAAS